MKRFVYMSSIAAVFDPSKGWRNDRHIYTAEEWNPITYEEGKTGDAVSGYRAGKKFAERALWDAVLSPSPEQRPSFDLVTFCPPMVFGPIVHPLKSMKDINDSNLQLWMMTDKTKPIPTPRGPCFVDVRDLAKACVEALVRPEISNKRYTIAAPEHFTYQRGADIVREVFDWAKDEVTKGNEGEPLPDNAFYLDGSVAQKDLGLTYRSFRETLLDSVAQFREIEVRERRTK